MRSPSTSAGNSLVAKGGREEVSTGPVAPGATGGFGFAPLRPDCPSAGSISNISSNRTKARISPNRFCVIDLGALEPPAVIDVNGFPFGKDIEHLRACFAMAVAGRFRPAERQMNFRADRGRVHVKNTRVGLFHRMKRAVYIGCINRRRQSIPNA